MSTMMVNTKQGKLLHYLQRGKSVSAESAFKMFQVRNLRATVNDLRNAGHDIQWYHGKNWETRYYIPS